jgi:hypothetical protein
MVGTMGALSALGAKATVQGRSPTMRQLGGGVENVGNSSHGISGAGGEQLAILRMIRVAN